LPADSTPGEADSTPAEDQWLSVNEVAAELGMHPSTVRKWANDGLLPALRIGRRQWRFRRSALRQLESAPTARERAVLAGAQRERPTLDPLALTSEDDLIASDER
jgi:excisionase family DNA binding protein